jgi:hypothetical protein
MVVMLLFLQSKIMQRNEEQPLFLREDIIADSHQTNITVKAHSLYLPTDAQTNNLAIDYANLWAHLNNLYATNNVEAGKEYYTEDWFKQICRHYNGIVKTSIKRTDVKHELHIINWSSDGLICTAIDSNVVFNYQYFDGTEKNTRADIAVVLLFQGDRWRLDGIRIINENKFIPITKSYPYEDCLYFPISTQQSNP